MKVLALNGLLGNEHGPALTHDVPDSLPTIAEVARHVGDLHPAWKGLPLCVADRGIKVEDLEQPPAPGADYLVSPDLQGIEIGTLLIYAAISTALSVGINFAIQALLPKPKPPDTPQDRGDQSSPTYDAAGLQTIYGAGFVRPILFGDFVSGGQVIYSEVVADSIATPGREIVRLIVALSEGRIESVGGITGGVLGEANALGGFPGGTSGGAIPTGIKINGTLLDAGDPLPGARVWLRMGELDQSPLPAPFRGARATEVVGGRLDDAGQQHVYTISEARRFAGLSLVVVAPAGLYKQDPGLPGGLTFYPVDIEPRWRPAGTFGAWQQFQGSRGPINTIQFGSSAFSLSSYAETWEVGFAAGFADGPIEVRMRRITGKGGSTVSDSIVWRQVVWAEDHEFAYPRMALLGLELETSELVSGNPANQLQIACRGVRVRCYDSTNGWSARSWGVPSTHGYYTHPIGNNPAWCVVEACLARWGGGRWIDTSNLDLDAFARWAMYCDQEPNTWAEPRCRFDGVLDKGRPMWEQLQAIAAAGNAALFMRGSQISVAYRFRDAHGSSPVVVPARTRTQLFAAPMLDNEKVRRLNTRHKPTILQYQFLNREKDYTQDLLPVIDPDSSHDDPQAPSEGRDQQRWESNEAFGVVRPSQIYRMGWLDHRLRRQVTKAWIATVPHHALAAEIGDLVGVQSTILQPYSVKALGMTITQGGTSVTTVKLDQAVTFAPGTTYAMLIRRPTGDIDEPDITSAPGTYPAGSDITLLTAVTCDPGAVVAVGKKSQVVEDYEIVSVTLNGPDLSRDIQAMLWTPSAYDEPTPTDAGSLLTPPSAGDEDLDASDIFDERAEVDPAETRMAPSLAPGVQEIAFARPLGRLGGAARVYVRPAGASAWILLGETLGSSLTAGGLVPWRQVEVAIALEDRRGRFGFPAQAALLTVEELPPVRPPRCHHVRFREESLGIVVRWDDQWLTDGDRYEVRRGGPVHGAQVAGRTAAPYLVIQQPKPWGEGYWVARRSKAGQYSQWRNAQDPDGLIISWTPPGRSKQEVWSSNLVSGSPPGTLTDLSYSSSEPAGFWIDAGKFSGSYETPAYTVQDESATEYEALVYWGVCADLYPLDLATLDDWIADGFTLGSGEALWRHVDFRPPTLARPGIGRDTIDEAFGTLTFEALAAYEPDFLVGGHVGHAGERAFAVLESRYYVGGAWTSWAPHRDGVRLASRIQARITLVRESFDLNYVLTSITIAGYV